MNLEILEIGRVNEYATWITLLIVEIEIEKKRQNQ